MNRAPNLGRMSIHPLLSSFYSTQEGNSEGVECPRHGFCLAGHACAHTKYVIVRSCCQGLSGSRQSADQTLDNITCNQSWQMRRFSVPVENRWQRDSSIFPFIHLCGCFSTKVIALKQLKNKVLQ